MRSNTNVCASLYSYIIFAKVRPKSRMIGRLECAEEAVVLSVVVVPSCVGAPITGANGVNVMKSAVVVGVPIM